MYYNNYSLRQLLELALRVPEVGAVNFNILYHILKTIIQNQGLEGVKPVFSLDEPLIEQTRSAETKLKEASFKRWHSSESIQTLSAHRESSDDKDGSELQSDKERAKWDKIQFQKQLAAVEEEISEIHIMLAQLVDKISNVPSQKESYEDFEQRLNKLATDVEYLMSRRDTESRKGGFEDESDDDDDDDDDEGKHEKLHKKAEESPDKGDEDKKYEFVDEHAYKPEKEKDKQASDFEDESDPEYVKIIIDDELHDDKGTEEKEKVEVKKPVPESKGKATEKEEKAPKKHVRHKKGDLDIDAQLQKFSEELNSIKHSLKLDKSPKLKKDDHKKSDKGESDKDTEDDEEEFKVSRTDFRKMELELMNTSAGLHKFKEKCTAVDKIFNSDINALKDKNVIFERNIAKCDADMDILRTAVDEMVHSFERMREYLQYMETQ